VPIAARADFSDKVPLLSISNGAVRRMRTRIELLVQPESMRSIIGTLHSHGVIERLTIQANYASDERYSTAFHNREFIFCCIQQ